MGQGGGQGEGRVHRQCVRCIALKQALVVVHGDAAGAALPAGGAAYQSATVGASTRDRTCSCASTCTGGNDSSGPAGQRRLRWRGH